MMKPGEQVVSTTNFRDTVLVIGSLGTVIQITMDMFNVPQQQHLFDLAQE